MTITPFLTLRLLGRKDIIRARQRARRVASLLSFEFHEQACIAAGAFVVACQALVVYGKARICFQIENNQLCVFAQPDAEQAKANTRLSSHFQDIDARSVYRLTKPLPPQQNPAEEIELGWMVEKVERTACNGLFDEIVRQNQEILALLHELRMYQDQNGTKGENRTQLDAA